MKILIAEQDELERKGIHWLIVSNQIPHETIVEVCHSRVFEELLKKEAFDLIIIDFDMLSDEEWKRIKHLLLYSKARKIVHSAHQTFISAKEALEVRAEHLFIKPISPQEWSSKVRKLVRDYNEAIYETKETNFPGFPNELLLYKWLFGFSDDDEEIKQLFADKQSFPPSAIAVVKESYSSQTTVERNRLITILKNELKEYNPYILPMENHIVLNMNLQNIHQNATVIDLEKIFIRLLRKMKEDYDLITTIGIGTTYTNPLKLKRSYLEAVEAEKRKFYYGNNQVFIYDMPYKLVMIDPIINPTEKDQLMYFVERHDLQGLKENLYRMFLIDLNHEREFPNPDFIRIKLTSVMANIRRYMLNNGEIPSLETTYHQVLDQILNGELLTEIIQKMVRFCHTLFKHLENEQTPNYSIITKIIMDYTKENYSNKISLEEIANLVGKNKHYISHLFKNDTGQSISEYIQKYRVEEAKKLLGQLERSIQEVGYSVGFEDQSYFSRIFKRETGKSPNEWRKYYTKRATSLQKQAEQVIKDKKYNHNN